jgi:hypothetical protein
MSDKIAALVKQASEVAKLAPENLQEAAFNKAFEALMAAQQGGGTPQPPALRAASRRGAKKATPAASDDTPGTLTQLDQLDRTAYQDIHHTDSSLNNSLRILRAAKDDLGIDGLSGSVIAKILVDKFRCRITKQAISLAMNGAGRYVNRHNEGNQVIFRIMAPGEDYLDALKTDPKKTTLPKRASKSRRAKAKPATTAAAERAKPASQPKPSKAREPEKKAEKKASQRAVSPNAALKQIHGAGFFSQPRTIGAIIEHLRHQHGRTFKAFEMSTPLVRLLRAGGLTRNKNADSQYEYKQP